MKQKGKSLQIGGVNLIVHMNKYGCDYCWIVLYHLVNNLLLFTLCYMNDFFQHKWYVCKRTFTSQKGKNLWNYETQGVLWRVRQWLHRADDGWQHNSAMKICWNFLSIPVFILYFCDIALSKWSRLFDWYTLFQLQSCYGIFSCYIRVSLNLLVVTNLYFNKG